MQGSHKQALQNFNDFSMYFKIRLPHFHDDSKRHEWETQYKRGVFDQHRCTSTQRGHQITCQNKWQLTHCTHWRHMAKGNWVVIGSDNGLSIDGTNSLAKPMSICYLRFFLAFAWDILEVLMNILSNMCSNLTLLTWVPYLQGSNPGIIDT